MKRRDFFRLTGAAAAAVLFGRVSSVSATNTDFVKGRRVDFHSHAILPSYSEGLKRLGIDAAAEEGFPLPVKLLGCLRPRFMCLFRRMSLKIGA